jgi:small-conductance mechanosensitive channel
MDVYWDARYAMLRRVKETFQTAGIDMPYPTQVSINKDAALEKVGESPALASSVRQA